MDQYVDVNGINLRCRVEGEGPDLVLVHGVGSRLDAWDGVVAALGGGLRTIRLDLRGHGESDKPHGRYELRDFTDDIVGLLDALGVERCHLAGHSLGGLIAQGFALDHPDRLDRLVLLSTVAGRNDEERARVEERLAIVAEGIPGEHFENSVARWFTDAFRESHPEILAAHAEANRRNDPVAYAAAYRVMAQTDLANRLHEITAPTLIATGDGDIGSNPRMARLMHEKIAASELCIMENLRHAAMTEAPERVAALISEFLK
jgi:3-oxoadipate enol-lactonase